MTMLGHQPESKVTENHAYGVQRKPWMSTYKGQYDNTYGLVLLMAKGIGVETDVLENNSIDLLLARSAGNSLVNFVGTKENYSSPPKNRPGSSVPPRRAGRTRSRSRKMRGCNRPIWASRS